MFRQGQIGGPPPGPTNQAWAPNSQTQNQAIPGYQKASVDIKNIFILMLTLVVAFMLLMIGIIMAVQGNDSTSKGIQELSLVSKVNYAH